LSAAEESLKAAEKSLSQKEKQLTELRQSMSQQSQAAAASAAALQQQLTKAPDASELSKRFQLLQTENEELNRRSGQHMVSIEKLMQQKVQLTQTVAAEVQRNGLLIKENAELKHTLELQKQIVASISAGSPIPQTQQATPLPIQAIAIPPLPDAPISQPVESQGAPSTSSESPILATTEAPAVVLTTPEKPPKSSHKHHKHKGHSHTNGSATAAPAPRTPTQPPADSTAQPAEATGWFGAIGRMWKSPTAKRTTVQVVV